MAEFEDKLNSILSNPALMNQIMSMAGSMGQSAPPPPPPQQPPKYPAPEGLPFDPGALQGMMSLLKSTQIDQRQQKLLQALEGYLPQDRLKKLATAMQAARIAKYASGALTQSR